MLYNLLYIDSVILLLLVIMGFLTAVALKRNDIADILCGVGCILVVLGSLVAMEKVSLRALVVSLLVLVWAGRQAARNVMKVRFQPEGLRYRKWRRGRLWPLRSFLLVFLWRWPLMLVILMPMLQVIGSRESTPISPLDGVGILLWLTGFGIEAVADYQLDRFRSRSYNRGAILQTGLWNYSRHPNHFGVAVSWWGVFFLVLCEPGTGYTVVGPVLITVLMLILSVRKPGDESWPDSLRYQEYTRRTSSFVPLPPRNLEN